MLAYNNIPVFLMAVIPVLLYSYLIYYFIPKNMVSVSRSRRYLVAGFLSPLLVFLFQFLFPNWYEPKSEDIFWAFFCYTFIQIALVEEGSKFITFQWVSSERYSEKHDFPIAIVFYSMMSAVGFAIVENVNYLINTRNAAIEQILYLINSGININPFEVQDLIADSIMNVALLRAVSAVVLHMLCGIIMGYFLAKAQKEKYSQHIMNEDDDYFLSHPKFKRYKYITTGIVSAAILHGMYNMNLMIPNNNWSGYFHIVNIFVGLIIGFLIIKSMINKSKILRKTNLLKNKEENETGG